MIPVNSRFASLNLAQAVLILGYEWMKVSEGQSLGRVTTYETPLTPGLNIGRRRPATKEELLGFFDQLEGELERLGFFNPPHRRATVVRQSAHDVLAHGGDRAGGAHTAWYCCHACKRQGSCPQAAGTRPPSYGQVFG